MNFIGAGFERSGVHTRERDACERDACVCVCVCVFRLVCFVVLPPTCDDVQVVAG